MVKIISQKGAEKAAAALVEQAEAQEIKDNLSVIVLEVSSGKEKTLASQLAFNLPDIPKMLADFSLPVWSNIPRSGKYAVAGIAGLVLLFLVILVATLPGDDGGDGSVADVPTAVSETQPLVEDEPALPDEETQSALPDSAVAAGNGRLLLPGLSSAWSLIVAAGMMMAAAIMLKTALKAVG
jgi:hypothetical protein